jgi:hypothetical protein
MKYFFAMLAVASFVTAQMPPRDHQQMAGMQMPMSSDQNAAEQLLMNQASGTALNPLSWPMPMFMRPAGSWNLMFMGEAFIVDTQQGGPRGGDKLYSTNMFMIDAEHRVGRGSFMLQTMLSLEPATITERRYPELFQTGETAFGKAIVDGQHPHNFVMGLGLNYAHPLGDGAMLQLYYAPVGDPALGPVAYPHRASAAELPQAPLSHHWQDSEHIANNVATVGVRYKIARLEASGFHGAEPGENRWTIGRGAMDSWSTRLSLFPAKNWMGQFSVGRLTQPERQEPGAVVRSTASLHYTRPVGKEGWSSSVIWGRNHSTFTHRNLNSYLAESVLPFGGKNFVTGRFELVGKDELVGRTVYRIAAFTAGYTRDIPSPVHAVETGVGANVTWFATPAALHPVYGSHPAGVNLFIRLRLKPNV